MNSSQEPDRLQNALVETWRSDLPESAELRRAYQKFVWRRREKRQGFRLAQWAVAIAISAAGLASAAVGVQRVQQAIFPPAPASAARSSSSPKAALRLKPRAAPRPASSLGAPPSGPTAEFVAPLESAIPGPESAAAGAEQSVQRAAERSASKRDSTQPPANRSSAVAAAESSRPPASAWKRAAKGLRERDVSATEEALRELEASSSSSDRDAARLIRAQLLLALGRKAEAEWLLENIASQATSASVRSKASALLGELNQSGAAQRSNREAPVTN